MEQSTITRLGDPLPASVAGYCTALDAGRVDDAVAAFSGDAIYAVPRPAAGETDPRRVIEGRAALRSYLVERGQRPTRHRFLFSAREGSACLVEGLIEGTREGVPVSTFAFSVELAADGLITRYLAHVCSPPVEPWPRPGGAAPADAAGLVTRYFAALQAGRFEDAAACFAEDVTYSHPPYHHTGIHTTARSVYRGRAELLDSFRRRGTTVYRHRVDVSIQRGPNCMFESTVLDLPGGGFGSAVASLSLDPDGLIARYVAFYCEPGVQRARA